MIRTWTKRDALLGGALSFLTVSSASAQIQNPPLVRAPPAPVAPPPTSVVLRPDQVDLLTRTLAQAVTHGFESSAFAPDVFRPLLSARDTLTRQGAQAQLIDLTLRYARAVRTGRLA